MLLLNEKQRVASTLSTTSTSKATSPGAARQLPTFLASPRKVGQRRRSPVCRPCGVPLIVQQQAGLRNSHSVLKQSSPTPPLAAEQSRRRSGEGKSTSTAKANPNPVWVLLFTYTSTVNLLLNLTLLLNLVLTLTLILTSLSPYPPPSSGDWSGDVGEDCLST